MAKDRQYTDEELAILAQIKAGIQCDMTDYDKARNKIKIRKEMERYQNLRDALNGNDGDSTSNSSTPARRR
ncbi:hypothetical protein [Treponema zioleckii]|uniref:hypothetical protein n=1 Tax=Treponema zioleckii TaxID=331680 RepID=UPI00168AD4AA|nr:hypothetical protein [Treponema zioleckii]